MQQLFFISLHFLGIVGRTVLFSNSIFKLQRLRQQSYLDQNLSIPFMSLYKPSLFWGKYINYHSTVYTHLMPSYMTRTHTSHLMQPVLSALNSSLQTVNKPYTGGFLQLLYNSQVPPILENNVLFLLYHPIPVLPEQSICCRIIKIQSVHVSVPPTWWQQ